MVEIDKLGVETPYDKVGVGRYLLGFLMLGIIGVGIVAGARNNKDGWLGIKIIVPLSATFWVIAIGSGFDRIETLEVFVTSVLLVGVLGIAAGIPWAVGHVVDRLTGDASR